MEGNVSLLNQILTKPEGRNFTFQLFSHYYQAIRIIGVDERIRNVTFRVEA
jgi:hypothetical protein